MPAALGWQDMAEAPIVAQMADKPQREKPDDNNKNDNEKKVTRNAEERGAAAKGSPANAKIKPEPAGDKNPQTPPRHRPQKRKR